MRKILLLLGIAVFTSLAFNVQAQKAYDGFNSGTLSTAADEANGWASGWNLTSGDGVASTDIATYKGISTGSCLKTSGTYNLLRKLSGNFPDKAGNIYWFSFNMNVLTPADKLPAVRGAAVYVLNDVSLATWPFTDDIYMGTVPVNGVDIWTIITGWPSLTKPDATPILNGETVNYVIKVVMSGNANPETVYCWINPDQSKSDLDVATAQVGAAPINNGIQYVFLSSLAAAGNITYQVQYDEIRLGTSFADVKINPGGFTGISKNTISELSLGVYPNPVSSTANISYNLKSGQKVKLSVYDMMGKEVAILVNGSQTTGIHSEILKTDGFKSGIYICKLQSGKDISTKTLVVQK